MNPKQLIAQSRRLMERHDLMFDDPKPLARILHKCLLQRLADGEVLCKEREPGDELYFLLHGNIEVRKRDLTGNVRRLVTLKAPTMFGHMALVDKSPRSATCVSDGDSVVAVLDRRAYQALLKKSDQMGTIFRHLLLSAMASQLARANDEIHGLIDPTKPIGEDDDVTSEEGLFRASSTLEGWSAG
ncbi:MAG: cyclic nucleotide-binding domain-containing protein [Alphaproteobacteria bacterium]|nr:cyclic nucleotide-binding domain-containing protein [Alphaproteobacteria bacterium]